MTETLTGLISIITSVIGSFVDFIFEQPYPGFVISIGAVLLGWLLIDLGFDYLDYFLHTSSHIKDNKK